MAKLIGNAVVGQSGGPTCVINQSLIGVVEAAGKCKEIKKLLGARHGVKGILAEDFLDLFAEPKAALEAVARTPSAALGSVRMKPTRAQCRKMFRVLQKNDVRYFFYIGGNDSAETTNIVNEMAADADYQMRVFHIPKTIDNDLKVTDHCPGFGSAAKFVAAAFMGDNLDNRSMPGIKINVVMGRHAGFLTAAGMLARKYSDDGPHLIYVPEVNFSDRRFIADVKAVHKRIGRCVVAVSEGIHYAGGMTVAEKIAQAAEVDCHGNVQLSGSGALGDHLAGMVRKAFGKKKMRIRADTLGYLQRSFPGFYSETDAREARRVGRDAVRYATSGDIDGSVAIRRLSNKPYKVETFVTSLTNVAKHTTSLPRKYINKAGNNINESFRAYVEPLVGKLPPIGRLKGW
ncbi:MAG: diphosphate--fructose-6-phosphate 1-phosphotransferase [Anaerolineaceae bacterium]|nr:diphosphate--fructose-6-phosphate 1-phosphotransferase [Anaerolineaceae bacterium]